MRNLVLATALALAPSLASAQSPGGPRTFAGCDTFACVSMTVNSRSSVLNGMTQYQFTGSGTFTILAPLIAGGYSQISLPEFGGPLFTGLDYTDSRYVNAIFLVGRAVGDVLPLSLLGYGRTEPVLEVTSFGGPLITPASGVPGAYVNITLTPTTTAPEPASLALVAVGITVGGLVVRRRRSA